MTQNAKRQVHAETDDVLVETVAFRREKTCAPAVMRMRFLADRMILDAARLNREGVSEALAFSARNLNDFQFSVRDGAYVFQHDTAKIIIELAPRHTLNIRAFERGAPRRVDPATEKAIRDYFIRKSILPPARLRPVEVHWDAEVLAGPNGATYALVGAAEDVLKSAYASLARDAEEIHSVMRGPSSEKETVFPYDQALVAFDSHSTARATLARALEALELGSEQVVAIRIAAGRGEIPAVVDTAVADFDFLPCATVTLEAAFEALKAGLEPARVAVVQAPQTEAPRDLGLDIEAIVKDITSAYRLEDIRKGLATLSTIEKSHPGVLSGLDVPDLPGACRLSYRKILASEKVFIDDLDESVMELGQTAGMDEELLKMQIADKAVALFIKGLARDSGAPLKKARADKIRRVGILTGRKAVQSSGKFQLASDLASQILFHESQRVEKAQRNHEVIETYSHLCDWFGDVNSPSYTWPASATI